MLDARERDCLRRYCELLAAELGDELVAIRMFGSAARGDMWPNDSPHHSDIDLLVVTHTAVSEARQEELLNETYPLYLECGRQLSPQFLSTERIEAPENQAFVANVEREGVDLWSSR